MKTITPHIRPAAPILPVIAAPAAASVELHIDAVVLHGFSRPEGHRAAAAMQAELTRLLTAHGLPEFSTAASAHLDAGTIRASAARPDITGIRAARAIHGGLRA